MSLTYIEQIPYVQDEEVMRHAVQIFRDSRRTSLPWVTGNGTLQHCENVAVRLVRTYVLMGNEGGSQNALLYAKVAELFGALWYFSSAAQQRIKYNHLKSELFQKA